MTISTRITTLLCLLPLAALLFSCTEEKIEQFPDKEFSKVVAYDYESLEGKNIIERGELHHSVKKEEELSKSQVNLLLDVLNDKGTYGGDITRCFYPRLGFVFYDKKDKPVAQVSICFQCNQHQVTPKVGAQQAVFDELEKTGYSNEGRQKLVDLCKSLSFSNCGKLDDEHSEALNLDEE